MNASASEVRYVATEKDIRSDFQEDGRDIVPCAVTFGDTWMKETQLLISFWGIYVHILGHGPHS